MSSRMPEGRRTILGAAARPLGQPVFSTRRTCGPPHIPVGHRPPGPLCRPAEDIGIGLDTSVGIVDVGCVELMGGVAAGVVGRLG
ncbi:hypothetical protein [Streptomyces albipurpureus]|uniref:Uncharacterized protein n=1 Tax=Streptomyces albipurpureus TaxID=2897419 RepID=A0ABT0UEQ0_9ACTN|nr:hypothetical protein [Streptomyces sp. CWNU-1]MCM2387034.1 hypothetical protein [Streptomyces sp. CWNU-1]